MMPMCQAAKAEFFLTKYFTDTKKVMPLFKTNKNIFAIIKI
jgi:hypothetical protein